MRKLLLFVFLIFSLTCLAQKKYEISDTIFHIPQVTYYGIDFSHVSIIREQLKNIPLLKDSILPLINLEHTSGYFSTFEQYLSKKVLIDQNLINSLNKHFVNSTITGDNDTIESILKGYKITQHEGIGLVFIVAALDKPKRAVTLYTVFFDIQTRKIIWKCLESGIFNRPSAHFSSEFKGFNQSTGSSKASGSPIVSGSYEIDLGLKYYWYSKTCKAVGNFLKVYSNQLDEYRHNREEQKRFANHPFFRSNGFFIKLIPNEFDAGYQRILSPRETLGIEGGFRVSYSNSWVNDGSLPPQDISRPFCFSGLGVKIEYKYNLTRHSSLAVALGYNHLYCPEVTWNPEGDDEGNVYRVYSETNNEFLFQLLHYIRFGKLSDFPLSFFYGLGFKICAMTDHYSIDGYIGNEKPSNATGFISKLQPLVTCGFYLRLFPFPHSTY